MAFSFGTRFHSYTLGQEFSSDKRVWEKTLVCEGCMKYIVIWLFCTEFQNNGKLLQYSMLNHWISWYKEVVTVLQVRWRSQKYISQNMFSWGIIWNHGAQRKDLSVILWSWCVLDFLRTLTLLCRWNLSTLTGFVIILKRKSKFCRIQEQSLLFQTRRKLFLGRYHHSYACCIFLLAVFNIM